VPMYRPDTRLVTFSIDEQLNVLLLGIFSQL
jgi:hypothetical protein